jgi:hypothetical protein
MTMKNKKNSLSLKKSPNEFNNQLTYEELDYYLQCII